MLWLVHQEVALPMVIPLSILSEKIQVILKLNVSLLMEQFVFSKELYASKAHRTSDEKITH